MTTPERIIMACLSDKRGVSEKTIMEQCQLEDWPHKELLKMMARKGYILYNKETQKYSINPTYVNHAFSK